MSAHRHHPTSVPLSASDGLHLFLALCSALTGTTWGTTMAVVVLAFVLARRTARRSLAASVAVRRGVLAPVQRRRVLHPAGHRREAVARP